VCLPAHIPQAGWGVVPVRLFDRLIRATPVVKFLAGAGIFSNIMKNKALWPVIHILHTCMTYRTNSESYFYTCMISIDEQLMKVSMLSPMIANRSLQLYLFSLT
jgi:hypothetical protein